VLLLDMPSLHVWFHYHRVNYSGEENLFMSYNYNELTFYFLLIYKL